MPDNDVEKKASIFLRNIDEDDRRRFKALCAMEGTDMSAVLIGYIKACVREDSLLTFGPVSAVGG